MIVNQPDLHQPAMAYIMGNVLICSDIHVAKKVAYDPRVQCLCVTLDGDKVNPRSDHIHNSILFVFLVKETLPG